jgi:hypothetical protein
MIQIDVGQGPNQDWHLDHKADRGGDANPRHDIHLSYFSVTYYLLSLKLTSSEWRILCIHCCFMKFAWSISNKIRLNQDSAYQIISCVWI